MNLAETMKTLETLGTAQNRKIYARHGAPEPLFGVSFANLGKLTRQIKRDHALAMALLQTKNYDAMVFATMIADPTAFDAKTLDELAKYPCGAFTDLFVSNVMASNPTRAEKMAKWMKSPNEWTGRAGFKVLAVVAINDEDIDDAFFAERLTSIEANIHDAKNKKREAMHSALIAIGGRNDRLAKLAIAAAKRIGPVEIDHGETNCKTPDAVAYIKKMRERAAAKSKTKVAKKSSSKKTSSKKTPTIEAPSDLRAVLKKNRTANAAWTKLSDSHRRAHIDAIEEAKKPATRVRRIEKCIEIMIRNA